MNGFKVVEEQHGTNVGCDACRLLQLQGEMVQELLNDISGTVSKASSGKSGDQAMSPDAAASLISEIATKATSSVTAFMNASKEAALSTEPSEDPSGGTRVCGHTCVCAFVTLVQAHFTSIGALM